jgi:7,8-dihydroneopterin aldolase/epimerase/oxygenase
MMDETYLAFEQPQARAIATGGGDPLDRISVRDYTREVEIGAFQAERGVTQRIRFNVVLEVSRHAAAETDDVDQVLSYDSITEAIEGLLSTERINLLETLAERVAERVLLNRKAVRVFVRIEKLDRIPGTLGVEIARSRVEGDNVVRPVVEDTPADVAVVHPMVVFLPNKVLHSDRLTGWLDAIANHDTPAIICVEQAIEQAPKAQVAAAGWRIELLSIEQNAWVLAGRDKRCVVVDSRTELDWALKHGQLSVWAPSKIVLDAVDSPVQVTPLDLARWFASELSAQSLVIAEGVETAKSGQSQRIVAHPSDL